MGLYFGNNKITGVHFGTVGAGGTTITLSAPTLSLNSNTGVVTATVTQGSSGYLTASSTSNTLSLTTQAATTITPTKSTQTAVAAGKYTLGAVTVAAIPSSYIIPSGTLDIITNGTHTVTNYASVSVNVPTSGATPTLQTKTATPTESTQMITADSGYDGLDSVEIEAINSTYVGSGVTRKAATTIHPATYSQTAAAANVYTTGVITVAAVPFTEIEYQGVHQDENGYLWPGIATNILRNSRSPMTYYGNDGAWDSGSWSVRSGGNGTGAACSGINANLDGIAILNNTSGNRDVYQKSFPYTPNATYTASFYAKMADSCTKTSITAQLRIWNDTTGKNHSGTTKTISSKTDWTLISLTFVAPASGILVFQAGISGAGAIDMSAFQLKSGVGVTEWAPSSYDFTLNSSGIDSIEINNATFDYVSGFKVKDTNDNTLTYIRPNGTYPITTNGLYNIATYENVTVNVPTGGSTINNQNKTVNPTESQQQITADSGYTGLGTVTINPISSTYIGSDILENSSTDLTVSGATVSVPAGYYATAASKSVATGTAGTPTATKGTVSNHSISITPSVTNTTGYITGSTKTGSAVTVSASELVSGTKSITANGTGIDVTNYASVDVAIATGSTINNRPSVSVTPTESAQTIGFDSSTYTGLSEVVVGAISSTYVGSGIARKTSADLTFVSNDNLFDSNSTVINAYNASGTGKLTSSANDRTVIIPLAINTEYTFTWNRTAINNDTTDDVNIGVFSSYPTTGATGRYIGSTKTTGGTITFTTTSAEHYAAIKIAQVSKTDFNQTLVDSTLYATNGNVISVPSGYYANGAFTTIPTETKLITVNGTYTPSTGKLISSVTVDVPTGSTINNQNKTVTPNETQQQITADSGYTGLGTVTISPISSTYIGSSILENSSTDLIVSDGTVTAPAGYYAADASASVATMTLPTAVSSTRSYTNKLTINRSTSVQYLNIPVGYNTTAASYTISAVANGSVTAPSTISGTTATVTTGTNTLTLTKTISVTPNVTTAGYISSGTAGNSSVSLTANITTKAAATITPGTSNQTIEAGTYLTGAQTISGDADLVAGNIKSGVNIFGVTGTYTGEAGLDTSDATATAADLLYNKTAYVDGSKITGTMPNNGATGGTITTQGGTYAIPAGYTSGGTVTANLTAGSTTAANISGAAFEESTGDYGFRASVQIQPGYYSSATTITKEFSTILPAPETEGTSAQVLAGYDLYNHDGQVISGTMTNNSIGTITLDQTTTSYTIPAGYHNGTGKVQHTTVDIPDPTISINSSTGVITASGSWTRGFTTDNSYSKTYNLTTLGATTYNVSTSNQTISSGRYLTGDQTIRAVTTSNITAANIKVGVTVQVGDSADADRILGVTGTFTSDANATAADINSGITAYVNGNKITGTQTFSTIHTGSSAPSSSLGADGDVYLVLV